MDHDIICRECSAKYAAMLQTARSRTTNMQRSLSSLEEEAINAPTRSLGEATSTMVAPIATPLPGLQPPKVQRPRPVTQLVGFLLLGIGLVALAASVMFASTILSFVGLGLAFWGMLAFFIQPQRYVTSDLMDATALSSLKTIDKMLIGIGYREKGVYIPTEKEAVVFVPSEPFSRLPAGIAALHETTFVKDPLGMVVVPPGLALANLIEKKLGFNLKNCGVETVVRALPKVLVEDLEIVRDVEIEVRGDKIDFKLIDSIYSDFCREIRDTSRRCGLGCPMCSALACVLAEATGKPVLFEEDELNTEKGTTISSYEILKRSRL
jgi:hypothetical protein